MNIPRGYMEYSIRRIINRGLALATAGVLLLALMMGMALPTVAANAQGSLTITPKVGDEVVADSYDGTFSLYLVATGVETNEFNLTDLFAAYDGTTITKDNLEDETTYKTIAQDLAAYIAQRASDNEPVDPDLDDLKAFTGYSLSYGLYLVTQKDAGATYDACTPILVMIPAYSVDADGTRHTTTNVTAYPKLTKPGEPGTPPGGHDEPTPPTHYGKVALGKSDAETGEPLQGVVFNLYKQDKTGEWVVIGTYTTDEKGVIYVDHVSYGDYYFEEVQTLENYILDPTHQEFKINSEDLVQLTMTNQKEILPVPDEKQHILTGDNSNMLLYGIVVVAAAVGLVVWIKRSRKER